MPAINAPRLAQLYRKLVEMRVFQLRVNEGLRAGVFSIPIHLAMGHEEIAVAFREILRPGDSVLLSHRNIAHNLAASDDYRAVWNEYRLLATGASAGSQGSMNFAMPGAILYASSILGNNLGVAVGCAFANQAKGSDGVTFVFLGDGAMEEGAFYETCVLASAHGLRLIVVVENNDWSMSTSIPERRKPIDLGAFAAALDVDYHRLGHARLAGYVAAAAEIRSRAVAKNRPQVVEVPVKTLGYYYVPSEALPSGERMVNYHSGVAKNLTLRDVLIPTPVHARAHDATPARWSSPVDPAEDPVFEVAQELGPQGFQAMVNDVAAEMEVACRVI